MKKLRNLDLLDNDVAGVDGYKDAVYTLFEGLEVSQLCCLVESK